MRIVWIHPHRDNHAVASLRFNVWPTHHWLNENGHFSHVAKDVPEAVAQGADVIVCIMAYDADTLVESPQFFPSLPNPKVIVFQSDGPECKRSTYEKVAAIVADSTYLETRIPAKFLYKTYSIADALEVGGGSFSPKQHPGRPLKVVWLGAGGNFFFAEPVITDLVQRGHDITLITDMPNNTPEGSPMSIIPWNQGTYVEDLKQFDVGIVPYPENLIVDDSRSFLNFYYKDTNRVATLQCVGLPVICSPLPSFLQYIKHGASGLIANRLEDWVNCLELLQDDPKAYALLSREGYFQSWSYSDPTRVVRQWTDLFNTVIGGERESKVNS